MEAQDIENHFLYILLQLFRYMPIFFVPLIFNYFIMQLNTTLLFNFCSNRLYYTSKIIEHQNWMHSLRKICRNLCYILSRCVQTTNQDKAVWFKMMNIEMRELSHKIIIFQVFNGFLLDRNTYFFYTPIDSLFQFQKYYGTSLHPKIHTLEDILTLIFTNLMYKKRKI